MSSSYYRRGARNGRSNSASHNVLMFLLKYALPFLIINGAIFFLVTSKPKLTVEVGTTDDYRSTKVIVNVSSLLPTKNLKASMDGQDLELTQEKKGRYTAIINKNGILEVSITSFNGMPNMIFESVDILDDNPPTIASHYIEDGILTFELEDSQSGVDFNSISATDSSGATTTPLTIDKIKGLITFTMDPNGLVVSVKDMSGHEIQATFTSHMEGGKEVSETTSEEITDPESPEEKTQ